MPLSHGKSKKAFGHNVSAEMHAGKPLKQSLAIAYSMKRKAQHKSHGGMIEKESGYLPEPHEHEIHNKMAMHEDEKDLGQHHVEPMHGEPEEHEVAHEMHEHSDDEHSLDRLAMGGYAHGDFVGKIMAKKHHYSEGGKVANDGMDEMDHLADGKPNQFDDLALRDDLESHYDGDGDHLGNAQEDHDRHDIISKILRKRMRQHNPNPA